MDASPTNANENEVNMEPSLSSVSSSKSSFPIIQRPGRVPQRHNSGMNAILDESSTCTPRKPSSHLLPSHVRVRSSYEQPTTPKCLPPRENSPSTRFQSFYPFVSITKLFQEQVRKLEETTGIQRSQILSRDFFESVQEQVRTIKEHSEDPREVSPNTPNIPSSTIVQTRRVSSQHNSISTLCTEIQNQVEILESVPKRELLGSGGDLNINLTVQVGQGLDQNRTNQNQDIDIKEGVRQPVVTRVESSMQTDWKENVIKRTESAMQTDPLEHVSEKSESASHQDETSGKMGLEKKDEEAEGEVIQERAMSKSVSSTNMIYNAMMDKCAVDSTIEDYQKKTFHRRIPPLRSPLILKPLSNPPPKIHSSLIPIRRRKPFLPVTWDPIRGTHYTSEQKYSERYLAKRLSSFSLSPVGSSSWKGSSRLQ